MTIRSKYVYWSIGGSILWAGIFYVVGHDVLGWPLRSIVVPYAILETVLLLGQVALYSTERIIDYSARVRRRTQIGGLSMLLLWTAILPWLLSSAATAWKLVLVCWLGGFGVGLVALWLALKIPLTWRLRNRPDSNVR